MEKLNEFNLSEYFLCPQINWNTKSSSIKYISEKLNISLDTIAFIDDQLFELEEVAFLFPQVLCINATDIGNVLSMERMNPLYITEDSINRRKMYLSSFERDLAEESFEGPNEEFLASLNMSFTISKAQKGSLARIEELTTRTNQLNTTGYTYSYEELDYLRQSNNHKLLIADLEDKFGSYGKIGLALIELNNESWVIKLLLMSCRVMSRGVGTIMLNHIMQSAKKANVKLFSEFIDSGRNRMMYVTYKFAGFKEAESKNGKILFQNDLTNIQNFPEYIKVQIID